MAKATAKNTASNGLLTQATQHCKAYREYMHKQYGATAQTAYNSYLFTREDLMRILYDASGEKDGIRIYIGFEDAGKGPLVRLYAVPCRQQGAQYHDAIEPIDARQGTGAQRTSAVASTDTVRSGRPCPSQCGGANMLNS
ncbi:hypothetical protein SAMN05444008_12314 [Cnuella takakiae]|uniref:Uncharacterized protein n=1 Tax=Cnuella takakiae TaxID=1302690 RepID=A0A1M5IB91_9BACT|nr:hypothetical protein [Cnuella takakiae]OLY90786.1 hypothetical protein BUE76_01885 [Cnuella takakiae]SHG25634.1 hypothetical protein SAMN05444008_12314 [Cnuella takakiae]